jgi:F-type H+-transporting ATPase subunit alpha
MKSLSKSLRIDYIQYKELLQMTQLRTTGLSKEAEGKLKRGEVINQLIVQDKNAPVSLEEQIIYLYALSQGILDSLSTAQIKSFKAEILAFINERYPGCCAKMRETREMGADIKGKFDAAFKEYLAKAIG